MTEEPGLPDPSPTVPPIPILQFFDRLWPFLFALAGILLLLALTTLVRSWLGQRRARDIPESQKEQNRVRFMVEAGALAKGSVRQPVRLKTLSKRLQLPPQVVYETRDYLQDKGLIKPHMPAIAAWSVAAGPQVTVTSIGFDQLDAARREPERRTTYLAPLTILGPVTNSVIMNASPQSQQSYISDSNVSHFTQQFTQALEKDPLPADADRLARAWLAVIEAQRSSNQPNQEVIAQAGKSLRAIAEGVASSAVWEAITALAEKRDF